MIGLPIVAEGFTSLIPASRVQPEPSWGAPLLKNQDQAWVLARQRVPTGLVAAPTTPSMEQHQGMMVSQNVFPTMVTAQNGANLCGNFLRIFGGVTLGSFPVKMTSIYFKIDSSYLAAL